MFKLTLEYKEHLRKHCRISPKFEKVWNFGESVWYFGDLENSPKGAPKIPDFFLRKKCFAPLRMLWRWRMRKMSLVQHRNLKQQSISIRNINSKTNLKDIREATPSKRTPFSKATTPVWILASHPQPQHLRKPRLQSQSRSSRSCFLHSWVSSKNFLFWPLSSAPSRHLIILLIHLALDSGFQLHLELCGAAFAEQSFIKLTFLTITVSKLLKLINEKI